MLYVDYLKEELIMGLITTHEKGLLTLNEGYTHQEALEFVLSFKSPEQRGWIATNVNYRPHVRGGEDGKGAVFTDGSLSVYDIRWYKDLLGEEATLLLIRNHTYCKGA